MKNKSILKILFLSLVLSSCGLIERFKTPEQPTDSKDATEVAATPSADATDDLFSKTMEESSEVSTASDNPSNLDSSSTDSDLKSLEAEFSSTAPNETVVKESSIELTPDRSQEAPVVVEEALPEIKEEVETPAYSEAGSVKSYRVQKGETLMQIAFKIYGDISKWKEIKNMNSGVISNNTSLKANTELKYRAPETPFVWNPAGEPHLIKNGETLGTISNAVYATPKKWKTLWENNKPLIKNPNVIYAGFTLYYTKADMANYVQPKSEQSNEEIAEEVLVDEVTNTEAPKTEATVAGKEDEQIDEAIQSLSAPKREETEVDLINNVTAPQEIQEIVPDIDEEIQSL